MRKVLAALVAFAFAFTGIVVFTASSSDAQATTPPFSGSAAGNIMTVGVSVVGGVNISALKTGTSQGTIGPQKSPESHAKTANTASGAAGINIPVTTREQKARPDNPSPNNEGIPESGAAGINIGALESLNHARWPNTGCWAPIQFAKSRVQTAGITIAPAGVAQIAKVGAVSSDSFTRVDGKAVTSTNTGLASDISVLSGAVVVSLAGETKLEATAPGGPGPATVKYQAGEVKVKAGSNETPLKPGDTVQISPTPLTKVKVEMPKHTAKIGPNGTSAEGSIPAVIRLTVEVSLSGPLGVKVPLANSSIDVLPMSVQATVPQSGAECIFPPPTITGPENGSTIQEQQPNITGTGVPGSTIEVKVDGKVIGTTKVGPDGKWTLTPPEPLAEGKHNVEALQTDENGNRAGPATSDFTIKLPDVTPTPTPTPTETPSETPSPTATPTETPSETPTPTPTATETTDPLEPPVITGPADGSETEDTTPAITGTGKPGAEVEVKVDGKVIGTTTVDEDGNWSITPEEPLSPGEHTITATQSIDGQTSEEATSTFTITEPEPTPTPTPTETPSETPSPTATPTETPSETPTPTPTVTETTDPLEPPVITGPADGSETEDTTPAITGTGKPGAEVEVKVDGKVIGTTTVDEDGNWSITPEEPLSPGEHTITATQSIDGQTSEEATSTFTITEPEPTPTPTPTETPSETPSPTATPTETPSETPTPTPTATETTDPLEPPVITGPADGSETEDTTPAITGTGKPGAEVEVKVDGKVIGTTTVDEDGNWSITPEEPLSPGEHTITATQSIDGQTSEEATSTFTITEPEPTPTPTPTETPSETPSPTATPTETPSETPSPTATPTETPSETPSPTATPTETPSETPSPTATPTDNPSETPSPTPTDDPTDNPSETPTPTGTPTQTPRETPTDNPSESPDPTSTETEDPGVGPSQTQSPVGPSDGNDDGNSGGQLPITGANISIAAALIGALLVILGAIMISRQKSRTRH